MVIYLVRGDGVDDDDDDDDDNDNDADDGIDDDDDDVFIAPLPARTLAGTLHRYSVTDTHTYTHTCTHA